MIYPSDIAIAGAGLRPAGVTWNVATRCACCGKPIAPGDLASPTSFGPSFTDDLSLAAHSGVLCGACEPLMRVDVMRFFARVVVTREAVFPIGTDIHRAWFLLTPPEPPFVAVVATTQLQHLVWRTPVTVSRDLLVVRLGQQLLRIRRQVMLDALGWCQEVMEAYEAHLQAGAAPDSQSGAKKAKAGRGRPAKTVVPKAAAARHPFMSLDRNMDDPRHGVIRPEIAAMPAARAALDRLTHLTPGEMWALATLAKRNAPVPEAPEPLRINVKPKAEKAT